MNHLTVREIKELIKNMPDDGWIYFGIPEEEDELFWRDYALVRSGELRDGSLYLEGRKITSQEIEEEIENEPGNCDY